MKGYNFKTCKLCKEDKGEVKYYLSSSTVYECKNCSFHYSNFLDEEKQDNQIGAPIEYSNEFALYIKSQLQSNERRFQNHVEIISKIISDNNISTPRILDIGSGGGLFLKRMLDKGCECYGIELDQKRKLFSKKEYGLTNIFSIPLGDVFWQNDYENKFDIITLWDVIEHVNFPLEIIAHAKKLLKPNGYLVIDTPCRDTFYYKVGNLSYSLSKGKIPLFIDVMYSNHPFGHKQILSSSDIKNIYQRNNLNISRFERFHELSFPYEFYLRKIIKIEILVKFLTPIVTLFFYLFRIKNKMLVIGKNN